VLTTRGKLVSSTALRARKGANVAAVLLKVRSRGKLVKIAPGTYRLALVARTRTLATTKLVVSR
jgi:hypothetical protein